MNILISACLLGTACRYDGRSVPNDKALLLMKKHTLIPVCAEILGGLPTPRLPAERQGDRVIRCDGADVTEQYLRGAEEVLRLARLYGCSVAVLKERSPSCGSGRIYDGSFSKKLRSGDGTTAELLKSAGITILGESQLEELL